MATFTPLSAGLPLGTAEDDAADMELPENDEEEAARTGEVEPPMAELLLDPDAEAATFIPLPSTPVALNDEAEVT